MLAALFGLILTAVTSLWLWDRARDEAASSLASDGEVLAEGVDTAIAGVAQRLIAVGGLYQASEEVTGDEFRRFVANFDPVPGMRGIGYMPIVDGEDLEEFEASVRETIPGYWVFELDDDGNRVPVAERDEYVPIQWFEAGGAFGSIHGFDSASDPQRMRALEAARSSGRIAATSFLRLLSEDESDGFSMYWPVTDPGNGRVIGFTVAHMDSSDLVGAPLRHLGNHLTWRVVDLDDTSPETQAEDDAWTKTLDVGGRRWLLTVAPSGRSSADIDPTGLFAVAAIGVLASFLAAAGVQLYRERSRVRHELVRLTELTRAKDEFLASVSHELRTPLTGVLGFAELLRDDNEELSADERRRMIENVADEATDLGHIIDDLLVAARSELDLLVVTHVPVSARAQVAQVLEAAGQETCQRIEVTGDPDHEYRMIGDPGRVRQILRNLISNACRYGGERVQVRFGIRGEKVHVEVADDGPGLPPEEWEAIFEPYYRAHDPAGQPAALGIGLSVARNLARLMGGDLGYRRQDDWSVFGLVLARAEGSGDPGSDAAVSRVDVSTSTN